MNRKLKWGFGALIILIIGVSAVLLMRNTDTEPDIIVRHVEPSDAEKLAADRDEPPTAREGFKMVPHGDHWPEVPIDPPDTWQGEPAPVAKDGSGPQPPVPQTYDGPLTYHAKLLETNPVKALRLQAEERGHWSKDHIPPFPVDDEEAATLARSVYIIEYYKYIGETTNNPALEESDRIENATIKSIEEQYYGIQDLATRQKAAPRHSDLLRLTWASLESVKNPNAHPSDYFPSKNNRQPPKYNYLLQK